MRCVDAGTCDSELTDLGTNVCTNYPADPVAPEINNNDLISLYPIEIPPLGRPCEVGQESRKQNQLTRYDPRLFCTSIIISNALERIVRVQRNLSSFQHGKFIQSCKHEVGEDVLERYAQEAGDGLRTICGQRCKDANTAEYVNCFLLLFALVLYPSHSESVTLSDTVENTNDMFHGPKLKRGASKKGGGSIF